MRIVYIYGLYDPRNDELRYIGKTSNLEQRLRQHIKDAKKGKVKSYKDNWIRQLLSKNLRPYIKILDTSNDNEWKEKEKYWIAFYRKNSRLTNIMNGGQGYEVGHIHTPEVIEKLRKANLGRKSSPEAIRKIAEKSRGRKHSMPEESKRKLREINLGKKHSPETIEKMKAAQAKEKNHFYGKKHTEETKAKMRKPHGPMSPEQCQKLSELRSNKHNVDPNRETKPKRNKRLTK